MVLLMMPGLVFAQSGNASIVAEATVFENESDENGGIYGEICIGNLSGTSATRRAFVLFDPPAIPDNAVVTRVVYEFTQIRPRSMCGNCPLSANIELRRVLEEWEEGLGGLSNAACGGGSNQPGVTWNTRPNTSATVSATEFMSSETGVDITIDTDIGSDDDGLIADIQAWVDNPDSNYGWEYRVTEESTADNARLLNPGTLTVFWGTNPELDFEDGFESP